MPPNKDLSELLREFQNPTQHRTAKNPLPTTTISNSGEPLKPLQKPTSSTCSRANTPTNSSTTRPSYKIPHRNTRLHNGTSARLRNHKQPHHLPMHRGPPMQTLKHRHTAKSDLPPSNKYKHFRGKPRTHGKASKKSVSIWAHNVPSSHPATTGELTCELIALTNRRRFEHQ